MEGRREKKKRRRGEKKREKRKRVNICFSRVIIFVLLFVWCSLPRPRPFLILNMVKKCY